MSNYNELLMGGERLPLVEDFYTIQGEGHHTGKAAYFIRLGGCDVGCKWCDAKFTWNPKLYPPVDIQYIVDRALDNKAQSIVITGGEPTLYPLEKLITRLQQNNCQVFLETSGTNLLHSQIDWICLSPKRQQPPMEQMLQRANELKVIVETVQDFEWAEQNAVKVSKECLLYLQPEWSKYETIIPQIVEYVKQNPRWMVSTQTHKFMHIP